MQKEKAMTVFAKEFGSYESGAGLEEWTGEVLASLPDYFWTFPASSTGKHHNPVQNGEHGNVIHTKMAVQVANILFGLDRWEKIFQDPFMRDMIRTALILHDGMKYGDGSTGFVVHEHPLLMADFLRSPQWAGSLPPSMLEMIVGMVAAHSGKWTTSRHSTVILPYPKNEAEYFVHICDYLGSRENILVCVDGVEDIFQDTIKNTAETQTEPSSGSTGPKEDAGSTGNELLDDEIAFVKMLVKGNNWNHKVYGKRGDRCIYLNGVKVTVDEKFLPAFQIVALAGG